MSGRSANSQAGWALVIEAIANARVETHRIRHLLNRLLTMSQDPRYAETLNRLVGDVVQSTPSRVEQLELALDRASYAMAMLGKEHLKGRLPLNDLTKVEEAMEGGQPFGAPRERSSLDPDKLARWYRRRVQVRQARRES